MSFEEAMALQPVWVVIWMNILLVGAFVAPLVLLIWRQSRKAGAITFVVSVFAGFCIQMMYNSLGYVKLLGLPHLLWIPVVMYLAGQARRADMPAWPRRIIWFCMAVICVSLAFDIVDVIRYVLGERAPTV